MTLPRFLVPSALALLAATGALAQDCAEPSALDVVPAAAPFALAVEGAELLLTWEDVGEEAYRVHVGRLGSLLSNRRYDHVPVSEGPESAARMPVPAGDRYFLAGAACAAGTSSLGRDSGGDERPRGGLARIVVGLEGGAAVFGLQAWVAHPPAAFTAPELVEGLGPFAPGAPGAPLLIAGTPPGGPANGAVLFQQLEPDPSFDPPPVDPQDVLAFTFGYHGAPPSPAEFELADCDVRDAFGAQPPGVACLVTELAVLP